MPVPKESGLANFLLCRRWRRWVHTLAELSFQMPLATFDMGSVQHKNIGTSHMLACHDIPEL